MHTSQRRYSPIEHRVTDLEYATWGQYGDNGLAGTVRSLKKRQEDNEAWVRQVAFKTLCGIIVIMTTLALLGKDEAIKLFVSIIGKAV